MRIRCRQGGGERQVPGRYRNRLQEDGEEEDGVQIPPHAASPSGIGFPWPQADGPISHTGFESHGLLEPALPA